jgi:DNA (cytosine-5)-methyltransferase 1
MFNPSHYVYGAPRAKAVTLFSGMGSSSKALVDLGYHVLPHDFNKDAVATLKANGFETARQVDVRDIDYSDPRYDNVEVLAGGPPCQPFSQAYDGAGQFSPKDMIPEFLRAVAELLPSLFVMEEVQTLTWAKHADYLAMVEDDMRAIGYRVEHRILNAADFGHGQARKRLFVVGVREDIAQGWDRFHASFPGNEDRGAIRWLDKADYEPVTLADALGWDLGDAYEAHQNTPNPVGDYSWVFDRAGVTVVGSFRADVQAKPGYRKAGDPPRQNTPGSVSLTLEERLILQDMPTDWVLCGSASAKDLQVGNSVPCGLIRDLIDVNIP